MSHVNQLFFIHWINFRTKKRMKDFGNASIVRRYKQCLKELEKLLRGRKNEKLSPEVC